MNQWKNPVFNVIEEINADEIATSRSSATSTSASRKRRSPCKSKVLAKEKDLDNFHFSLSKNVGHWSVEENALFMEGFKKYGKNCQSLSRYIGTRTVAQVHSHFQKLFPDTIGTEKKYAQNYLLKRQKTALERIRSANFQSSIPQSFSETSNSIFAQNTILKEQGILDAITLLFQDLQYSSEESVESIENLSLSAEHDPELSEIEGKSFFL
eukprot:TRINITY_DN3840_c0_g1_i6.p1 TRINITY_DN3840_c0_g1~~TRINITY_DN3840_c0_g1_i6.p1  ORF type:complete len:211 (+),score=23.25 TRINITY_DN3840_c0_g1_i6:225-857(+)